MRNRIALLLLSSVIAANASDITADRSPEWFDQTEKNAWLIPYDTTLITRRAFSEFSYESHDDGDHWKIENSFRGAYAIGDDLAFGLQMMVPVKWIDTTASDESGLGDLEFRSGFIGRISPALRWGAGMNVEFDQPGQQLQANPHRRIPERRQRVRRYRHPQHFARVALFDWQPIALAAVGSSGRNGPR